MLSKQMNVSDDTKGKGLNNNNDMDDAEDLDDLKGHAGTFNDPICCS